MLDNEYRSTPFGSELEKIKERKRDKYRKIYMAIKRVEKLAQSIQTGEFRHKNLKILTDMNGLRQFRVDDYRLLFYITNQGVVEWIVVFEKKRNTTSPHILDQAVKIMKNLQDEEKINE